MSRNGSGTYSLPVNSWNPATNAVSATASDWQSLIDDVETALTASLAADGQTPMTGNLAMGNNKLTGLAAGTAAGNSLRWEQLFSQGTEVDIASATTTDIGGQNSNFLRITGTTMITSFGTNYNGPRFIRFADALTLTDGTALNLPGSANITTVAGDYAIDYPKANAGGDGGFALRGSVAHRVVRESGLGQSRRTGSRRIRARATHRRLTRAPSPARCVERVFRLVGLSCSDGLAGRWISSADGSLAGCCARLGMD